MRDIETITPRITHEKFRAFMDSVGDDIKQAQERYDKFHADMRAFTFETELVLADAMRRWHELKQEMD